MKIIKHTVIPVTCVMLFLNSCQSNQSSNNYLDSIRIDSTVNIGDNANSDSLEYVKKYGDALNIAYEKIRFGITEKEFKKSPKYYATVSGSLYDIYPLFTHRSKKLYGLELGGSPKTANYIDAELQDDLNKFSEVIEQKYGKPDMDDIKPSFFNFKPGYIQWVKSWKRANKKIYIGMSEISTGSQYKVVCRITDEPLETTNDKEESNTDSIKVKNDSNNF